MIVGKKMFGVEGAENIEAVIARNNTVADFFTAGIMSLTMSYLTYNTDNIIDPFLGESIMYGCIGLAGYYGLKVAQHYKKSF